MVLTCVSQYNLIRLYGFEMSVPGIFQSYCIGFVVIILGFNSSGIKRQKFSEQE